MFPGLIASRSAPMVRQRSGGGAGRVKLWDVETGDLLRTLSEHTAVVGSVAFSPDGATLASGSDDNTVKLVECLNGRPDVTMTGHSSHVDAVAFSPNGRTLASGSHLSWLKLWQLETGEVRERNTQRTIRSVSVEPRWAYIVFGGGRE